jgi:hypothetical protein
MLAVRAGPSDAKVSGSATAATGPPHLSGHITISALDNEEYLPSVAYNWKHREYLVVWHTSGPIGGRDILGARISDRGQVLSTFGVHEHMTRDSAQAAVAYDPVNDRYLVVWIFDAFGDGSDWELYGRFIPWDGPSASLSEFPICTWPTHQWNPKVAYGRAVEEYLVVWNNEYQSGALPMYISGRRVKADGSGFPGSDSDLTINHGTENRVNADVTYNLARNEYLVVYDNAVDIFGMRLTGDLFSNFGGEFGIAGWPDTEHRPAVAACEAADQYFVAWQSFVDGTNYDIYGRFINGDGTVADVRHVRGTDVDEKEPDVACGSGSHKYLVVWEQQYSNLSGPFGVWGRFLRTDTSQDDLFAIVAGSGNAERTAPAVAGGPPQFMVAWEHDRSGTMYQDIHGRLTSPMAIYLPLALRKHAP